MKEKIQINSDALMLRKFFGEETSSPIDIFSMLNTSENLTVVFYPMSERISGLCIKDEKNKLIGINSALTYGRQRFTAAHELCHLYYHVRFTSIVCAKDLDQNKDPLEKEANMFASFFLAPYEAMHDFISFKLKKRNKKLNVNDIIKIEQYFGLSRQATLWRLLNDGYLTFDEAELMKTGIIKSAQRLGFDIKLYLPTSENKQYSTFGKYIKLAEELKDKNLISYGKYEELLLDAFRGDIVYGLNTEGEEWYD